MSTHAFRAVRRPATSGLLQRMLRAVMKSFHGGVKGAPWLTSSGNQPRRSTVSFEALEPRFLLSADLVGDVSAILLQDQFLPSHDLTVPVVVHDIGSDASEPIPAVRLYDSV